MDYRLILILLILVLALQWDDLTYGGPFVGSKNSDVYHRPGCMYANRIKVENRVWFRGAEEAEEGGYRMARVC
ncbi:Ada metal-binding domain-containing protein [archaeon]